MSKEKNKMQFYRNRKFLITAFLVVIFVIGLGGFFMKKHKSEKQAQTKELEVGLIPGWWYQQYFSSSVCEKEYCKDDADFDKDGLTTLQEYYYHTDPREAHTIGDELSDGQLVAQGFDPSRSNRVTFEQAATDESILGETLLFGQDVKKIIADDLDINNIDLPLVQDDELELVYGQDAETYKTYTSELKSTMNAYFQQQDMNSIKEILKSGSDAAVENIKNKSRLLSLELKTIAVPQAFVQFHKYNIMMFQLLSEIIPAPLDLTDSESDIWFEKVQRFLLIQDKLNAEEERLKLTF